MSHSNIAVKAMLFAREAHKDQVRRYTGNPYHDHLAEVAGIVSTVTHELRSAPPELVVATAWLHDVVEDQFVEEPTIVRMFGVAVGYGVMMLSDLEQGNREERKRLSRERMRTAEPWVQTIKVADLISNTSSIVRFDRNFSKVYLEEKSALLDVLTHAHPALVEVARAQIAAGTAQLRLV